MKIYSTMRQNWNTNGFIPLLLTWPVNKLPGTRMDTGLDKISLRTDRLMLP